MRWPLATEANGDLPAPDTTGDTGLVSLAEAKRHLALDHDDDDDLITAMIAAAVVEVEKCTNQEIDAKDLFSFYSGGDRELMIPRWPVTEVTTVYGIDESNDETALAATDWRAFTRYGYRAVLIDADTVKDYMGPDQEAGLAAWKVEYSVGGSPDPRVRAVAKGAVLKLVGGHYEARESESVGPIINMNPAVERMLRPICRNIVRGV